MSTPVGEVVLVYGAEEWGGAYVDGALVLQNHSVDLGQLILHGIGNRPVSFKRRLTVDQQWLDIRDELPQRLDAIPASAIVHEEAFGSAS